MSRSIKRLTAIICLLVIGLAQSPQSLNAQTNTAGTTTPSLPHQVLYKDDPTAIKDQYIVVLNKGKSTQNSIIQQGVTASGAQIIYSYDGEFSGFAAVLPQQALESLRNNPDVSLIEADRLITLNDPLPTDAPRTKSALPSNNKQEAISLPTPDTVNKQLADLGALDGKVAGDKQQTTPSQSSPEASEVMQPSASQPNAPWGLDRIDQRAGRNSTYNYTYTGSGVRAYILDTGIRSTHQQFGGRVQGGYTAINDGNGTNDCQGHGTHVAGTVGSATYGVAKSVTLIPVRVLGCNGSGSTSGVIAGVNWVRTSHIKPAVANMSLGGSYDAALNQAVTTAIQSGVPFVVASGNEYSSNACAFSPGSAYDAIAVVATDSSDQVTTFSNTGTCNDIGAPGKDIISTDYSSDTAISTKSGTSMASPHVAGVVAQFLQRFPSATPTAVTNALASSATYGRLGNLWGAPNMLLYTPLQNDCLLPELRYYSNRHFYTTSWHELSNGRSGWNHEGIVGYLGGTSVCLTGSVPYYRYNNRYSGAHFYTTNYNELGGGTSVWRYEGIVGYLLPAPSSLYNEMALYRYYNMVTGVHFYTTNFNELGNGNSTYRYEGIPGYILSNVYRQ
ncbi:MAG: S8 family peptidase [Herpetosiphon sp.]|nr:S8 family peptidase [Herpetosiphon sp.]